MSGTLTDIKTLAECPLDEQVAVLRSLGDPAAEELATRSKTRGLFGTKPWQHSTHRLGFFSVEGASAGASSLPIRAASQVEPDVSLSGVAVDIKLDRLRVFDYPGSGIHRVLVTFDASHQGSTGTEAVTFNQAYDVPEGDDAGVAGFPVFRELTVPAAGIAFRVATTNISNAGDEKFLQFLQSGAVTMGLGLLTTAQPALKPLVEIGQGLARTLGSRNQNVKVQEFTLGLDFDAAPMGARLRLGNYVAVQVNDTIDWTQWVYDRGSERIVNVAEGTPLPFNYVVFRVSRHAQAGAS